MSETNGMSATEKYRAQIENREAVIVDVQAPSGFVYKFEKPSRFGMLFTMGNLPVAAANAAVESWQKNGVVKPADVAKGDEAKLISTVMSLRDRVLSLSRVPKLVVGPAKADNELSTDDVTDEDLEYLFKWVSAGGDASAMLAMFPTGPQPGTLARSSRKKQRTKSK